MTEPGENTPKKVEGSRRTADTDRAWKKALGDRLRTRAGERKLSKRALAQAVGTHPNVVTRWFDGETSPSAPHLAALATTLRTSVDWIVRGPEAGESPDPPLASRLADLAPALTEAATLATAAAGGRDKPA